MASKKNEPTGISTTADTPDAEPGESAGARSLPEDAASEPGKLRRLLRSGWTIGIGAAIFGAVIGAVASAFFISNPHLLPNIESGGAPKRPKPPLFSSEVVESAGTWDYSTAKLARSRRLRFLPYNTPLQLAAYCIGQPTRNERTKVIDERWLILTDRGLVPAPAAKVPPSLAATRPRPCPGEGRRVGGPQSIRLSERTIRHDLFLSALAHGASSIGFAVFALGGHRWRSVALALAKNKRFSARVPLGGAAVAMAVACWAARAPARPNGQPVYQTKPLNRKPSQSFEDAIAQLPAGIPAACAQPTYGAERRVRNQKTASQPSRIVYAETTLPPAKRLEPYTSTGATPSSDRTSATQEGPVIHHPEE